MARKLSLDDLEKQAEKAALKAAQLKNELSARKAAEREKEMRTLYDAAVQWRDAFGWTTEQAVAKLAEYAKSAKPAGKSSKTDEPNAQHSTAKTTIPFAVNNGVL